MRILNITNGDGAAGVIKASAVPGDVLPWRDPMHHGPFPANASAEELRQIRAEYLAGPGGDIRPVQRDFALRDEHLNAAEGYDKLVLWFEHDLLDQLQILQILDWCAQAHLPDTQVEIICINQFPGITPFRGIGQLSADQMATLPAQSQPVTPDMLHLAQAGWAAFRSDDPNDLHRFAQGDLSVLPFLSKALMRHLEELPWRQTGLTRTEHQVLTLVEAGVQSPVDLFQRNMDFETALFIGDWPTYTILQRLCDAEVLSTGASAFQRPSFEPEAQESFAAQRITLTELGLHILAKPQTPTRAIKRDMWMGGVHLRSGTFGWMWDAEARTPVMGNL